MPQVCTVCRHPQKHEIDEAIIAGEPFRNIAKRYGTSAAAVFRHKDHLPEALMTAHEIREAANVDDLLGQVQDLRERFGSSRRLRLRETCERPRGRFGKREAASNCWARSRGS